MGSEDIVNLAIALWNDKALTEQLGNWGKIVGVLIAAMSYGATGWWVMKKGASLCWGMVAGTVRVVKRQFEVSDLCAHLLAALDGGAYLKDGRLYCGKFELVRYSNAFSAYVIGEAVTGNIMNLLAGGEVRRVNKVVRERFAQLEACARENECKQVLRKLLGAQADCVNSKQTMIADGCVLAS